MIDSDYYALELIKSSVDLIQAEEFTDVEKAFNRVIDRAQQLTREKYAELAEKKGNIVKSELHDEAVQAQGGL